jgi:hypothetical protein
MFDLDLDVWKREYPDIAELASALCLSALNSGQSDEATVAT